MTPLNVQSISTAFVAARQRAMGLARYPGDLPTSLDEAYEIQDRAIELADDAIVGWKVGRIAAPYDAALSCNRLAGPIFAASVAVTDQPVPMPVFADGFAAVEAEFMLRIGAAPDPSKRYYSHDAAVALIDEVRIGLEIASSPFPGINDLGPLVTISDYGNNHGLVIGDVISNWRDLTFVDWPVRLLIDAREVGAASAATMLDGPIGAVRFLLGCLAERGIPINAGQWISSGAITGVHLVRPGQAVTAVFGENMAVGCTIKAATPLHDERGGSDGRGAG